MGRKQICGFMGMSWKTVKRKEKQYGLPIRHFPPDIPYIDTDELSAWRDKYEDILREKMLDNP